MIPVQVWLSQQRPETLDPATKYLSQCTITGKPYVATEKVRYVIT